MNDERLVFSAISAHRGWYVVEYAPPVLGTPFAALSLTTLEHAEPAKVAEAMESELSSWLARYPVPIMVSAFSDAGELLDLSDVRECDHLFGWLDAESRSKTVRWRVVQSSELPVLDLTPTALRRLYSDVRFKTGVELRKAAMNQRRAIRLWKVLVFAGLFVVPGAWLLIDFNAPRWLEWLILFYGVSQLYIQALKLTGLWPKAASDLATADEERRMRHHH